MVAHTSVKTPTKAAQFIVQRVSDSHEELMQVSKDLLDEANSLVEKTKQSLETKTLYLDSFVTKYFQDIREDITKKGSLIVPAG